jgi:hypothetical protein
MKVSIMKAATIIIYVLALIALSSIILSFVHDNRLERMESSEIENIVLNIYAYIDKGNFTDLYNLSFEGKWNVKEDEIGIPKSYLLDELIDKSSFIEHARSDYGKNGWRLHFTSLEITNVTNVSRSYFANKFPHENEILNYIDQENSIKRIYIVFITGYIVGSCAIIDWEKELPLIWTNRGWKAIVTGTPEDLSPIHREQWLTDINFRIASFG